MSNLYSYKGAYPYPLPSNVAEYDINDFVLAPDKPELISGQSLKWDGENWQIQEPTSSELAIKWQEIRDLRNRLLNETDARILRFLEVGTPVPNELVGYRQALRDLPQSQSDPFNIVWPSE
jgi:hypothetical protein